MLENVIQATKKSATKRNNNRKQTKVFDPCISNKKKKVCNDFYGDENNSFESNNQLSTIKKHLLSSSKKDINKAMDELCNELGMNKCISEDDLSDEDFSAKNVPKNNDSVENCLNKMFEGLDEYAAFNARSVSTPKEQRRVYSAFDSNIKPTPGFLTGSLHFESVLTSDCEKSLISQQNESCNKTPLTERRISFGSSKLNESDQQNTSRTPFMDKTNLLQTPDSNRGLSNSNFQISPRNTPKSVYSVQNSFNTPTSLSTRWRTEKTLSPDIEVPPEIKRTLLVGVSCFVDVKTNKEDCSSSVALELLSMGACVEKTFNKKVTHVVFKEGRPSTYLKAKKVGVTMVSVLWIEACKKARHMVDPTLYPPVSVDKYESLSLNGVRLPTLKTIQRKLRKHLLREAGLLTSEGKSKGKVRINWRNAITDMKVRPSSSQEHSQGRLCTKKLNFQIGNKDKLNFPTVGKSKLSQDSIITVSESPDSKLQDEPTNNSGETSDFNVSPVVERRNSAPARFITTGRKRKRKEGLQPLLPASQKFVTIDKLFSKQMALGTAKRSKLYDGDGATQSSQTTSRKRKLFNPEEAIIIIDSPEKMTATTPPPVTYDFPYRDEEKLLSTGRRTRTRSTSVRKIFKKVVTKKPAAKKSLCSLLEQEEGSSSTRSSLTYFVDVKKNEPKVPKDPPTIVCTSLLPEEVRKVSYIVGKLGVFDTEERVSSRTTHLVTSAPRRTINLLKALVRGAWILHIDWLIKSEEAGYWLNEEEFELKTFSHVVTEMRRERQAFGPEFCSELFFKCGPMYVSKRSAPPCSDLVELIRLCKGRVVTSSGSAELVIGGKAVAGENLVRLKEKWILDSITQNTLLDTERYLIKVDKT